MADQPKTADHDNHDAHAEHHHDPVLHVKDGYFFEVPRGLWSYHSVEEVPAWIREKNADGSEKYTLEEYKAALDGKIIIKQPFGTPKNLYESYPLYNSETGKFLEHGVVISKYMVIQFVVAGILVFLFSRLALHVRAEGTPKGRLWNMLEAFLLFLRDNVIRPSIDGEHGDHDEHGHGEVPHGDPRHDAPHDQKFGYKGQTHHPVVAADGVEAVPGQDPHVRDATHIGAHGENHGHDHHHVHGHGVAHAHAHARESDKFLPFLWTLFFFILFCNLFGILPWLGSPTGAFSTTLVLAGCTFLAGFIGGNLKFGPIGYWMNQIPSMDLPLPLAILLKPMIFAIEVAGLAIKHVILAVRLLANMVAGHLVIAGIMGLITGAAVALAKPSGSDVSYWITVSIACIGSALFFMLELFVAFLQAYVFVFLSSLFIGAAVHKH
jgi:F-type H+-transporting ATPase subunit a